MLPKEIARPFDFTALHDSFFEERHAIMAEQKLSPTEWFREAAEAHPYDFYMWYNRLCEEEVGRMSLHPYTFKQKLAQIERMRKAAE